MCARKTYNTDNFLSTARDIFTCTFRVFRELLTRNHRVQAISFFPDLYLQAPKQRQ